MNPQDTTTNQPDDPNAGFVPIGGPVGEGFVEIVPETPKASQESLPVQEIYTTPTVQIPVPQTQAPDLTQTPPAKSTKEQKIVNKTTSKEHLHAVGQNADAVTKLADKEETDFIEQVEEHHKAS